MSGRSNGRRRADLMSASGQLTGRLRAVSRGRRQGIRSVEKPLSAIRRTWSRHAGRSVLSGATTPNRKLLAPPVASLPVIVAVLSIHFESIVRAVPLLTAEQAPTHRPHARHDPQARPISAHTGVLIAIPWGISALIRSGSASTSRPVRRLRVHRPPAKPPVVDVQVSEEEGADRCGPVRRRSQRASIAAVTSSAAASRRAVPMSSRTSSRAAGIASASASPLPTGKNGSGRPCTTSVGSVSSPRR